MTSIIKKLPVLLLPFLISACSPKVITKVYKTCPEIVNTQDVYVIDVGDSIVGSYEEIGEIKITDNGFSVGCNYDLIIFLAKNETSKAGGNAIALTRHRTPDNWSTCHRIKANMLILEEIPVYEEVIKVDDDSLMVSEYHEFTSFPIIEKHYYNTFYANFGYSNIYSKLYMPYGVTGDPKKGLDLQAGYDLVFRNSLGVGLFCAGHRSSYSNNYSGDIPENGKLNLIYIAPQFIMCQDYGSWITKMHLGIGYFGYSEKLGGISEYISGYGSNINMNIEYLITSNLGVGINIGYIQGKFSDKQKSVKYEDDEYIGISRLFIDAGIRWHF